MKYLKSVSESLYVEYKDTDNLLKWSQDYIAAKMPISAITIFNKDLFNLIKSHAREIIMFSMSDDSHFSMKALLMDGYYYSMEIACRDDHWYLVYIHKSDGTIRWYVCDDTEGVLQLFKTEVMNVEGQQKLIKYNESINPLFKENSQEETLSFMKSHRPLVINQKMMSEIKHQFFLADEDWYKSSRPIFRIRTTFPITSSLPKNVLDLHINEGNELSVEYTISIKNYEGYWVNLTMEQTANITIYWYDDDWYLVTHRFARSNKSYFCDSMEGLIEFFKKIILLD